MFKLKKGYDCKVNVASTPEDWEITPYRKPIKKSRGKQAKA